MQWRAWTRNECVPSVEPTRAGSRLTRATSVLLFRSFLSLFLSVSFSRRAQLAFSRSHLAIDGLGCDSDTESAADRGTARTLTLKEAYASKPPRPRRQWAIPNKSKISEVARSLSESKWLRSISICRGSHGRQKWGKNDINKKWFPPSILFLVLTTTAHHWSILLIELSVEVRKRFRRQSQYVRWRLSNK